MTPDDSKEFFTRLAAMSELFDSAFSAAKAELYFEALRDLELDDVIRAMNESVQTCKFMPRPAEIRTLVIGDSEDLAEFAWQEWKVAARRVGSYRNFLTDDPALGETLRAVFGGWVQACTVELSPEMWTAKRKEFGRVYRMMRQRELSGPRELTGHFAQDVIRTEDLKKLLS